MSKSKPIKIHVQGTSIAVQADGGEEYLSLTDIARFRNSDHPDDVIRNWLRNCNTLEFIGVWERLNNPSFKLVEFDGFRNQAELNVLSSHRSNGSKGPVRSA